MTEQGFNELAGKKVSSLLPTLSLSKHYTTPLPQLSPPPAQNPTPSSLRESLSTTITPYPVCIRAGFAKMRHAHQRLIRRNLKALFEGKSERDRAFGGERKVLPHLMQKGFEGDQASLPLDSYFEVKMSIKTCENDDLEGMDTDQGWRDESPKNAVWIRVYAKKWWRKGGEFSL